MYTTIISYNTSSYSTTLICTKCYLPEYYYLALVELGLLLSFKYVLSESNLWQEFLKSSLNMGIFPLYLSFGWIVICSFFT